MRIRGFQKLGVPFCESPHEDSRGPEIKGLFLGAPMKDRCMLGSTLGSPLFYGNSHWVHGCSPLLG